MLSYILKSLLLKINPSHLLNSFRSPMVFFYMTILFIFLNALDLKFFVLVMIPLLLVTLAYFGINKTTDLVSRNYWWPSMHKDIKKYVRSCNVCCASKVSRHNPYGLLKSLPFGNIIRINNLWLFYF